MRPEPLFIITKTLQRAKAAATDRGLPASPWTPYWIWVSGVDMLRGRRDIKVLLDHDALLRPDWPALRDHLAYIGVEYVE